MSAHTPTTAPPAAPAKTTSNALAIMAARVAVSEADLQQTLMATAFKGATPAEFLMLVAVANKYNLDPFVREIYAFPKSGGGIVPLVPIDGWLKIIRENKDFAGMDIAWSDELVDVSAKAKPCPAWVEVTIHHKSMPEHPTVHREYIDEMYRETGPWQGTTKRMLEWKGIIQAGRVAFGLSGIYDQDEAERINDGEIAEITPTSVKTVEPGIGPKNWEKLARQGQDFGYTEADMLATAATAGYEGDGPGISEDLAKRLYAGMKENQRGPALPGSDDQQGGIRTPMVGEDEA